MSSCISKGSYKHGRKITLVSEQQVQFHFAPFFKDHVVSGSLHTSLHHCQWERFVISGWRAHCRLAWVL